MTPTLVSRVVVSVFLVLVVSGHKCNHTDLVWDASRSGVGVPATCTDLSLVEESIGDVGAGALAQQLGGGGGDVNGASDSSIGSVLQIQTLDLYENHIGDEGARLLSKALANPSNTLKELYLWGNTIGNAGAADLAKALEVNTELEALVMWNNNVGDKGCDALLKALETNTKLSKLYLTGNKVSSECLSGLKARLSHSEVTKRKTLALARGTDCVVGEFKHWSECEGPCGQAQGFQHRDREVLTPRSGEHGRKCPALEEVRSCVTSPCPKDRLNDFMNDCKLSDPMGVASLAREVLGASEPEDLFELDGDDLESLELKVAQRKRLIRCVCDASGDEAPCCDAWHKGTGRHHASVDDIMKLAEVVRRGDVMATDGLDCDGALGLYDEALSMSQAMRAHNFYGEVSFKVFLVKTRCVGHRTPSRQEAEACSLKGVDLLGQEWLFEDFRKGVTHGWSKKRHQDHHDDDADAAAADAAAAAAAHHHDGPGLTEKGEVKGIVSPDRPPPPPSPDSSPLSLFPSSSTKKGVSGGEENEEEEDEPMAGLHWSSWYELFGTSAEACNRQEVDKAWSLLMLKYNADQAYRHPWSSECANLASILVSSGRELLFQMAPCGKRLASQNSHEEM